MNETITAEEQYQEIAQIFQDFYGRFDLRVRTDPEPQDEPQRNSAAME